VNRFIDYICNLLFQPGVKETRSWYIYFTLLELLIISLIVTYTWNWAPYITRISDVVLPLGLAQYIDVSFMFNDVLPYVNAVILTVAVIAGFFRLNRYAYLIAVFAIHFQYISRYSLGEISHGSNMAGLCLLALAAAAIAYGNGVEFRKLAFGLILFFMGMAYTSAGICKLIGTGPHWIDGRHLWLWIGERSVDVMSGDGAFELNLLQEYIIQWHWLATIILLFGLFTELIGVMAWSSYWRPLVITLLVGMHFGIEWSMNISFSSYVYILILVGYPWYRLIEYGLNRLNSPKLNSMIDRLKAKGPETEQEQTLPGTVTA
jgi:hypothetical protein